MKGIFTPFAMILILPILSVCAEQARPIKSHIELIGPNEGALGLDDKLLSEVFRISREERVELVDFGLGNGGTGFIMTVGSTCKDAASFLRTLSRTFGMTAVRCEAISP